MISWEMHKKYYRCSLRMSSKFYDKRRIDFLLKAQMLKQGIPIRMPKMFTH